VNAARTCIVGATTFLLLLALLHFLKPELDPSWRMISEYEIGEYGWVMTLAFLSLSVSYATLLIALLPHARGLAGRIGLGLLLLGVVGTFMGGIFTSDPITASEDQLTAQGNLHGVGALLGIPTLPLAATLICIALLRNASWASARVPLLLATALTWVGLVGLAIAIAVMLPRGDGAFGPEVTIGWPNRFLIVTYAVWLIAVARQVIARRAQVD
jgi:hypothetical protein